MAFVSEHAKELEKWNLPKSQGGMRPDHFEPFPRMVYKAKQKPGGGPFIIIDPTDDAWSGQNYQTVGNEEELERALKQGWSASPGEAIEYAQGEMDRIAKAAAHRHYEDKKLSPEAQAEAAKADASTMDHLPEIPAKPVKRRGRPPKVRQEVA